MNLDYDRGGSGPRLLVLLHGLGATREVWQPMLETVATQWSGTWIVPDLRGHGRSPHATNYALGCHAADVADIVHAVGGCDDVVVLGHSMGGAIALELASGSFDFTPRSVFGLGIKVAWQSGELEQLAARAASPVRFFESQDAAVERYLKTSGLAGLVNASAPMAVAGVTLAEQGWRLAADPATASVGAPPMRELLAAAAASVHLARGTVDALVTHEQLLAFDTAAINLTGGHNVMVENPDAVWQWIAERLA